MADALHSQLDLFGGLYQWADYESPKALHKDRLTDSLQITVALPDTFQGLPNIQRVQCRVKEHATQDGWASGGIDRMPAAPNSEVTLSDLMAGQDITGWPAQGRLYDLDNSIAYLTFDGVVAELDAGSGDLTIENLDLAVLNQDLPKRRLIDLFPAVDLSTAPTPDPRVIKCFSEMRQVRLTKLFSATGAHGYGAVCTPATIATVYSGRRVVPTARYQIVELIHGLLIVVFSKLPVDTTGRELEIHCDITSTAFATHADCGQWVLTDTLDGLGQRVNATSFAAAAAAYTTANYLPGGGIGPEPVKAQTLLNDLALRGAVIQLNSTGQWTWTVDAAGLHTAAQYNGLPFGLGRGDGQWENIDRVTSYKHKRLDERSKSYTMQGLWSGGFGQGSYLLTATATRAGVTGVDMPPVTNAYISDITTLRRETGYRLARMAAAEQSITVEVINEARVMTLNSLVPIIVPSKRLDTSNPSLPWQCVRITGQRDNWTLELAGYNSAQYSATAGSFTVAPGANVLTDFTFTNPDAPTGFAVTATEFVTASDGPKQVLATLQATGPADNINQMVFQVFKPGATFPQQQRIVRCPINASTVSVVMRLTLGQTYDLQAFARNTNNADEFQDGTVALILGHPAGTDTTAPATPTGLTATAVPGGVALDWANSPASDFSEYRVLRFQGAAAPAWNVTTHRLAEVSGSRFTDSLITIGLQYWYTVVAYDTSENVSGFATSVTATPTQYPANPTPPSAPGEAAWSADGTYQASDGVTRAFMTVIMPAMPSGGQRMNLLYSRSGTARWIIANEIYTGGTTQRIDDLTPGLSYNIGVQAISPSNVESTITITSGGPFVAPGDVTAPAQVTSLTLTDQPPRGIKARWSNLASTTPDLSHYELNYATTSDFSTQTVIRELTNEKIVGSLTPGTTYYFRCRAYDNTGNSGTYSTTASRVAPRIDDDDYGDDTIGTLKLKNLSVTNAKINDLSAVKITTGLLTINPSTGGATALLITNAGTIRLQNMQSTPSRIVFEDGSSVARAELTGGTNFLRILPTATGVSSLSLGETSPAAKRWNVLQIDANNVGIYVPGPSGIDITSSTVFVYQAGGAEIQVKDTGSVLITSTTGGLTVPRVTTTQQNAISAPLDGTIIYNTTTAKLRIRAGGAWADLH